MSQNLKKHLKNSIKVGKSKSNPTQIGSKKLKRRIKFDSKFEELLMNDHRSCLKNLNFSISTFDSASEHSKAKLKSKYYHCSAFGFRLNSNVILSPLCIPICGIPNY